MDVREANVASAQKPSSHFGTFRHLLLGELSTPKGVLRVLYSFRREKLIFIQLYQLLISLFGV